MEFIFYLVNLKINTTSLPSLKFLKLWTPQAPASESPQLEFPVNRALDSLQASKSPTHPRKFFPLWR